MFSVTQFGKPLDPKLYKWDAKKKIFETEESHLVLDDFSPWDDWDGVTFKTGDFCVFKTDGFCVFITGNNCTFDTGSDCTFKTGDNCTFDTGSDCTFETGNNCTFDTGSDCTFKTGNNCTFNTSHKCTFETGKECICIRRDIYEVIEIPENTKIRLNDYFVKGYKLYSKYLADYLMR
jgi:hypothetical protein